MSFNIKMGLRGSVVDQLVIEETKSDLYSLGPSVRPIGSK